MVAIKAGVVATLILVLVGSVFCDETDGQAPTKFSAADGELQSRRFPSPRYLSKSSGGKATKAKSKNSKSGKAGSDRRGEKGTEQDRSSVCGTRDVVTGNVFNHASDRDRTSSRKRRQTPLDDDDGCFPNGLEVARKNTQLSTFVDLLEFAGIEDLLSCDVRTRACSYRLNLRSLWTLHLPGIFHDASSKQRSVCKEPGSFGVVVPPRQHSGKPCAKCCFCFD
jgi:hypothetical protein